MRHITELARDRRAIFYDELGNLNPLYYSPNGGPGLHSLAIETDYHIQNLRLLALYNHHIIVMLSNVFNFTNHTTKAVVLNVLRDGGTQELVHTGILIFAGWGAHSASDMVKNQIDYALTARPELKEPLTTSRISAIANSGSILLREDSSKEGSFAEVLLSRLKWASESAMGGEEEHWDRVQRASLFVQEEFGHVGTLNLYPFVRTTPPAFQRKMTRVYLDAWLDYATMRYAPVNIYESPRLNVNPDRWSYSTAGSRIASVLLSPHFFRAFIRRFISKKELARLLIMSPDKLLRLRNGDWAVFCERYHQYIVASSEVFRRLTIEPDEDREIFDEILEATVRDLPAALDAALLADFLAQAVSIISFIPGISLLTRSTLRPLTGLAERSARKIATRLRSRELYPFIAKLRAATC